MTRNVPAGENSPFVERVLEIIDDETRSAFIALGELSTLSANIFAMSKLIIRL